VAILDDSVARLTDREATVIRQRFGLGDTEPRTLEQIGLEFGVTRERIRQIEDKALRKLRHPQNSALIADFVGLSSADDVATSKGLREDKPTDEKQPAFEKRHATQHSFDDGRAKGIETYVDSMRAPRGPFDRRDLDVLRSLRVPVNDVKPSLRRGWPRFSRTKIRGSR
jgi:hypothetical protein